MWKSARREEGEQGGWVEGGWRGGCTIGETGNMAAVPDES